MRKRTILVLILLALLLFQIVKIEPTPDFEITNVEVETTKTNATIKWTTTVDTKPSLEYYAEENFTRWGRQHLARMHDYPYSSNHSITLYNVKPSTTYLFRVTAKDINGNPEIYESNFTTREVYIRGDIAFRDLMVTPKEISSGENVSIQFFITNKRSQERNIGFIIEHHPPVYLIIDEESMTLKFFQFAESISLQPNQTILYVYFPLSSNYVGVNTVIINYLGGQALAETFTVNEIMDVSSIETGSQSNSLVTRSNLEKVLEVLVLIFALIVFAAIVFRVRRDKECARR